MAKSRPNILLIMCDQMRWDAAGFAGSSIVQTPIWIAWLMCALNGRSVADAILNGRQPEPQPIFAEIASQKAIYCGSEERAQFAAHVMNRDGRWKYIRNRFDIDELYDLQTDPGEMQNLAQLPEHQPHIATMRRQIAEMICHTGPSPYEWCLDV